MGSSRIQSLKETKMKKKRRRRRRRKKDMYDVPAKLWKLRRLYIDIYRSINDRQNNNLKFCQREKAARF
jgi:hypothetical protein